jgi:hypothetical protein
MGALQQNVERSLPDCRPPTSLPSWQELTWNPRLLVGNLCPARKTLRDSCNGLSRKAINLYRARHAMPYALASPSTFRELTIPAREAFPDHCLLQLLYRNSCLFSNLAESPESYCGITHPIHVLQRLQGPPLLKTRLSLLKLRTPLRSHCTPSASSIPAIQTPSSPPRNPQANDPLPLLKPSQLFFDRLPNERIIEASTRKRSRRRCQSSTPPKYGITEI